jgi:hypothetical protein
MDERFDKLENKLDKLDDRLDTIGLILEKNTAALEYHIKRTDILETSLSDFKDDLKPVEKHVAYMQGAAKLIAILSLCVGLIIGIVNLSKLF